MVIDKWGNPVQNVYVRKVERVGGQLQNSVIFTYPAVSQFWKYNPDEFLKMPALHAATIPRANTASASPHPRGERGRGDS